MKGKVSYTDEPMGKLQVADDFLPATEELVFKPEAKKHHGSYQAMIRRLVDLYASQHARPLAVTSDGRAKWWCDAHVSR
jgi:hypothetical protein